MKRILAAIFTLILITGTVSSQDNLNLTYPAKFNVEEHSPVKIMRTGSGTWFADFGKDAFGTLILRIRPAKKDTLVIHLGEKLADNGSIDRNPGGTIRYQKVKLAVSPEVQEYLLQLPADKRNSNPPAIRLPVQFGVITPFRYCEIENFEGQVEKDNIKRKAFFYQFDENDSFFTCSDTVLNKIWDLCKYSMKATSFCGIYIDGDRERIPYEGDALINQLSHYAVDDEYSLARRTNEYFMKHPTWPTEWILHTVALFYYDYLYTGDPLLLNKYYESLKVKTLIDLGREDGLISVKSENHNNDLISKLGFSDTKQRLRDIVDWPPAQKDTGWKLATSEGERDGYEMTDVNTVVNAFHFYNLRLMAEIAGWLGKRDDVSFFTKKAELVRTSINTKLFDRTKGIYIDGEGSKHSSLHANMFPLAFGLVSDEYKDKVTAFIRSRGMACSVYGSQHLLDGLYLAGEDDYALELMTSLSDRSWWNMIRIGSTITLEAWDMKYKPNSDWNHAWGAAPANIISRRLWGIRPVAPGFKKAVIEPQPGNLESMEITVPTITGKIKGSYVTEGNKKRVFKIDVPAGISAEFVNRFNGQGTVHVNNKMMKKEKKIYKLKTGINTIEIE